MSIESVADNHYIMLWGRVLRENNVVMFWPGCYDWQTLFFSSKSRYHSAFIVSLNMMGLTVQDAALHLARPPLNILNCDVIGSVRTSSVNCGCLQKQQYKKQKQKKNKQTKKKKKKSPRHSKECFEASINLIRQGLSSWEIIWFNQIEVMRFPLLKFQLYLNYFENCVIRGGCTHVDFSDNYDHMKCDKR